MINLKKIILLIGITVTAWGQGSDTIFKTLYTNQAVPVTSVLPAVNNRGQAGHQVAVVFANNGANVCSDPASVEYLEGSYDNSNWISFGTNSAFKITNHTAGVHLIIGQGAYSYIRLALTAFDAANCRVSAYYAGSITIAPITAVQGVVPRTSGINAMDTRLISPVLVGGTSTNFAPNPFLACDTSITRTVTTLTSPGTIQVGVANKNILVCGFLIVGTATGTAQLVSGTAAFPGDCTTAPIILTPALNTGPTIPSVAMGGGIGSIFIGFKDNPICLLVTGAGNSASVMLSYSVQ